MSDTTSIGLDNQAFRGRLRQAGDWQLSQRPVAQPQPRRTNYTAVAARPVQPNYQPSAPASFQPQAPPARPAATAHDAHRLHSRRPSKLQLSLMCMAGLVFVIGLAVSLQAFRTNSQAAAQVSILSKKAASQGSTSSVAPGTSKPSGSSFSSYSVAPDLPRYLQIPKLGVNARVLSVGVDSSGALGTPFNVYDTAWYTGSAKPGQPGATLIDGHVSSWTTPGVFYGLKTLKPGDAVQIVRGDGTILNYRVVKTQVYDADNVDMKAAVTPITAGKSGLNLITCTGRVKPGTSEFNQRIIAFTEQV